MRTPILPNRPLTIEQFLELEAASPLRHEFVGGEVYAMTGESRRHGHIGGNIFTRLHAASKGGPCEVYFAGIKLRVGDAIYYPDVMVTCSATDSDDLMVREPCLLIEITSPSTARSDRTEKRDAYQSIVSLQAYLIVEQAWRRVVWYSREASSEWVREELQGEGTLRLPCPTITLTLDEIYEGLAPLTVKEMEAIGYAVD